MDPLWFATPNASTKSDFYTVGNKNKNKRKQNSIEHEGAIF